MVAAEVAAAAVRRAVVAGQRVPPPGRVSGAAARAVSGVGGAESGAAVPGFADAGQVLRRVGLLQLDPLMRVSTAQRLTCLTRLSKSARAADVDAALWPADRDGGPRVGFEAFTKVACLFPVEDWPLLRLSRERHRDHLDRVLDAALRRDILAVVAAHPGGAPIGAIETGAGVEHRTTGWDWSEVKRSAELMVRAGELVITARQGTTRLFDLPERGLPAEVLETPALDEQELLAGLAARAVGSMIVATEADIAHHYHLSSGQATLGVRAAGLVPVAVEGWRAEGWCTEETARRLAEDDAGEEPASSSTSARSASASSAPVGAAPAGDARLIGPFDPLLRDRRRASRILGFDYLFEAYVPAAKRRYGHYVMGVLSGERMVARADVQRVGDTLRVNGVFPEPGVRRRAAAARARAAAKTLAVQLGAGEVVVGG